MTKETIESYRKDTTTILDNLRKKIRLISNLRLLFALIIIFSLAEYFRRDSMFLLAVGIGSTLVFIYLVNLFKKTVDEETFLKTKLVIFDRYEKRLNDTWQEFDDDGSWYTGKNTPLSEDLDLFGKHSLYQYLSVAHTARGRKYLADTLLESDFSKVLERQEAVADFLGEDDFAFSFEAMGYQSNDRKRKREEEAEKSLIEFASSKSQAPSLFYLIAYLMPIMTVSSIVLAFFGQLAVVVPVVLILAQIGLTVIYDEALSKERDVILPFAERVKGYESRLELLDKKAYQSSEMRDMKEELFKVKSGIKGLKTISDIWQWRENFLFYWIFCGIFAWDFNLFLRLQAWKKNYGKSYEAWLFWIAKVECYLSLGMVARLYPKASSKPKFVQTDEPYLEAVNARHPLLNPKSVISNSHSQGGEMIVITGSNMSGKSTFMRMLGLNTVLAYAGGYIAGDKFVISPMKIFTSMRVRDDVSQGISTFYGEILRVKNAVSYAKEERPMLVLIDEIFKGTNSKDRILGAKAAIKKLSKPWIMGIVTTHDFELADMVTSGDILGKNYHFEEHYVDDEIKFDYTIKEGRSQSTNAKHLMRIAGLLDEGEV